MTRKELAEQVNLAYDQYFNSITELGNANKIVPPSSRLVGDDPRTAKEAASLWSDFQAEQSRLNNEYSAEIEAKHAKDKE